MTKQNSDTRQPGGGGRATGARFTAYADGKDPDEAFARAIAAATHYERTAEEYRITHKGRFTVIGDTPVLVMVALDTADRIMREGDRRITAAGPAGAIAVTQYGDGTITGWLFFGLITASAVLGERARAVLLAGGFPDSAGGFPVATFRFKDPGFYLAVGVGVTVSVAWENPSAGDRASKVREYEAALTRAGLTVQNHGSMLFIPEQGNG